MTWPTAAAAVTGLDDQTPLQPQQQPQQQQQQQQQLYGV